MRQCGGLSQAFKQQGVAIFHPAPLSVLCLFLLLLLPPKVTKTAADCGAAAARLISTTGLKRQSFAAQNIGRFLTAGFILNALRY